MMKADRENAIAVAQQILVTGKAGAQITKVARAVGAAVYGDKEGQTTVADWLVSVRTELVVGRREHIAELEKNPDSLPFAAVADMISGFTKSIDNAIAYLVKVTGEAAGCKFKFDKKNSAYTVEAKAADGEESGKTADGKNATDSSADINAANESSAEIQKQSAQQVLMGHIYKAMRETGASLADVESAVAAIAAIAAQKAEEERKAAELKAAEEEARKASVLRSKMLAVEKRVFRVGARLEKQRALVALPAHANSIMRDRFAEAVAARKPAKRQTKKAVGE